MKYVLGFVLGYIAFMLLTPLMADLRYANPLWDNMPVSILAFGDQIHGLWLMLAVVIAAIIIITGYAEATRARATSI